jgi:hypothetical protein
VGLSKLLECRIVYSVKNLIAGVIDHLNLNESVSLSHLSNALVYKAQARISPGVCPLSQTLKILGRAKKKLLRGG